MKVLLASSVLQCTYLSRISIHLSIKLLKYFHIMLSEITCVAIVQLIDLRPTGGWKHSIFPKKKLAN